LYCWTDSELVWIVKARATVEVDAVISTQSATHTVSQTSHDLFCDHCVFSRT